MLKFLRVSVSAIVLSTFVVAPVVTFLTADYAYAKNGNGNGKSGGNGKGGGDNGKGKGGGDNGKGKGKGNSGKSADKGNKSKGFDKGQKTKTAGKAKGNSGKAKNGKGLTRSVKDDFKSLSRNLKKNGLAGLFSKQQNKKQRRTATTRNYTAPAKSTRPSARLAKFEKGTLHPSNLGKLNGTINSSPNAKAAHIANGNYASGTGPVSLAAALAVADYDFAIASEEFKGAQETVALDEAFDVLDVDSLPSPEDAQAILDDAEENPDDYTEQEIEDAQKVVDAAELTEGEERPGEDELNEAIETVEEGEPSDEDVTAAEDALLAAYKGHLAEEEEDQVLDAVRDANPSEEIVEDALNRPVDETPDEGDDDDDVTIDDPDDTVDEDTADSLVTDEEIISEQG